LTPTLAVTIDEAVSSGAVTLFVKTWLPGAVSVTADEAASSEVVATAAAEAAPDHMQPARVAGSPRR
jgi:hypothetical protein